jgi:DNA-binding NtrC family response regulator
MSTILIIDDDKDVSAVLMQTMTELGHAVSCAHTLAEGLKKSIDARPDVVFLDVLLPDGDGLAALGDVRSAPSEPEVIIFTGEGDPDSAEAAIQSGAWDCLQKPATVSAIAGLLKRALAYRDEKRGRPVANAGEPAGLPEQGLQSEADEPILAEPEHPPSSGVGDGPATDRAGQTARSSETPDPSEDEEFPSFRSYRIRSADAAERHYLVELMARSRNRIQLACELSQLSRPRLYALLSKHGITRR